MAQSGPLQFDSHGTQSFLFAFCSLQCPVTLIDGRPAHSVGKFPFEHCSSSAAHTSCKSLPLPRMHGYVPWSQENNLRV